MGEKKSLSQTDSRFFILTAVNIGATLEWYEIGLFISWPLIIQPNTLSFETSIAETINAGAVLFVIAMILMLGGARALGGWFFGKMGDEKGRRKAFISTILLAALPSWFIVLLSFFISYEHWVTFSTIIFTGVKFFQGMPAGGELPGAMCYLSEVSEDANDSSTWNNSRYMCSYAMLGPQIGLALSTIVCLVLKFFFSQEMLQVHIWKYVFLVSGILGVGGFFMRKKLHETAGFLNLKIHHKITHEPVKTVFHKFRSQLSYGFVLSIFEVVSFSVLSIMPLFYLKNQFSLNQETIVFLTLGFSILCIFFLPIIGYLSSRYSNLPWLKVSAWGVICGSSFLYRALLQGDLITSLVINFIMIFLFSIQAAILPSLLVKLFPSNVRYTGLAFSFNICDGVLWSLITTYSFWLMYNNNPFFVLFLPIAAIIFLTALWKIKKRDRSLIDIN